MTESVTPLTGAGQATLGFQIRGHFNLSIRSIVSPFVGTVTVQRSWNNTDWFDVDTFTSDTETYGYDPEEVYYRAEIKVGEWTSGTVAIRFGDDRDYTSRTVFLA
jgi:hypothetical protein